MQTTQFKKPAKIKSAKKTSPRKIKKKNDEEITLKSLDFRELRDDEITPEIAAKIKKYRKMSDEEFISINSLSLLLP